MSHEQTVLSSLPQTPVIGRIVHYINGASELPAIVTRVWNEDCVNLQVFPNDENGIKFVMSAVHTTNPKQSHPTWHWPGECQL